MERVSREDQRELEVPELLGDSPAWVEILESLPRVASSDLPVLVLGETGTGKELVARAIHALSARRRARFVAHNCGATPDSLIESELFGHARGAFTGAVADRIGLFEAAEAGTLFLDEIGDASALLQMKLLRVLQEGEARRVGETRLRKFDVRIVSATHRRLEDGVSTAIFRADLYYRLNTVRLRLPPLRERGRDVLVLARHFLVRAGAPSDGGPGSGSRSASGPAPALAPSLAERLLQHSWPGNVRELWNACAYAVRVAGAREVVGLEHWPDSPLPERKAGASGLHAETRALEEQRLRETLERTRWNKSRAARSLGLSRQGLLKKLRRYGLTAEESSSIALDGSEGAP